MLEYRKDLISDCAPRGNSLSRDFSWEGLALSVALALTCSRLIKIHSYIRIGPVALSVTFIRRA
jgi:hypothetical protein